MIQIESVSKVFPTRDGDVVALDDVSLSVASGRVTGVIGGSGAGKSTLIRCVNLLERPTSGTVRVGGVELTALSSGALREQRRRIGMIFQHFNLLDSRTVARNVAYPLELAGIDRRRRKERVGELLELVGLAGRGSSYPAQLSGRQKQRVAIARALADEPAVLLSDEATSALDPETTGAILALLRRLNQQLGLTILLITHEMQVVTRVCDDVALMAGGRIVDSGSVTAVAARPGSPLTRDMLPELPELPARDGSTSLVEVTLTGVVADQPLVANLIREFDLDVNILGGAVTTIGGARFGRLRLEIPARAEELERVLDYLRERGAQPELVA